MITEPLDVSGAALVSAGRWRETLAMTYLDGPIPGASASCWALEISRGDELLGTVKTGAGLTVEERQDRSLLIVDAPLEGISGECFLSVNQHGAHENPICWARGVVTFPDKEAV
jgi:hypothetical protein